MQAMVAAGSWATAHCIAITHFPYNFQKIQTHEMVNVSTFLVPPTPLALSLPSPPPPHLLHKLLPIQSADTRQHHALPTNEVHSE